MDYHYLTKTTTLPVSGIEAEIREADSYAEDCIDLDGERKLAEMLTDYWAYCTKRLGDNVNVTRDDILALRTPDQEWLAIEIYRLTYGDTITLVTDEGDGGHEADMGKLGIIPLPEGVTGPDPTFTFKLPRTGHTVVYGYRTGAQELEELNTPGFNPGRMVWLAIRTVDGQPVKLRDVKKWPGFDHKALRKDMVKNRCGYDTRIRLHGRNGKTVVVNLFSNPSFLLPGLMV